MLDKEVGAPAQSRSIERVQHRVSRAIGRGAAATHRRALAILGVMAAERALVDFAVARACERHAIVFELIYSRGCVSAQILDRVLVPEPVRSLDGVVHVPAPVVRSLVTERGPNAAFGRDGVRASGKDLRDAGGS